MPPVLLFVDDEPEIVDIAKLCFEGAGWQVIGVGNTAAARTVILSERVDAVLSDIMMRGGNGIELLDWVRREKGADFVFFLLTGCIDDKIALALAKGAHGVFNKPCDWNVVVQTLSDTVETQSAQGKGSVARD